MKKLFVLLAVSALLSSCTDTETDTAAVIDSARAAATTDSLANINTTVDTSMKPTTDIKMPKMDSSLEAMPITIDSIKK